MQLTSMGADGNYAGTPRWSPDGKEIVFDARFQGNPDIFVVSAQGGAPRRVTTHPAEDVVPSFSRDGRWIYFASSRSGDFQVWKAPREGGEAIQLTRNGGYAPIESVDGKYLYFMKSFEYAPLFRMPTSGGEEITVLTELPSWKSWTLTNQGVVCSDGSSNLNLLESATGRTSRFATLPPGSIDFTVSPAGHILVYSKVDQHSSNIMLLEDFL